MRITLNGRSEEIHDGATVAALLERLGMKDKPAAVEVNKDLVPKKDHQTHELHEGDTIEVLTLVGGG